MNFSLKKKKTPENTEGRCEGQPWTPSQICTKCNDLKRHEIFGRKLGRKKVLGENFLEFLFLVIFPKIVPTIFCEKLCFVSGTTSRLPSFRGNTTRANKKTV